MSFARIRSSVALIAALALLLGLLAAPRQAEAKSSPKPFAPAISLGDTGLDRVLEVDLGLLPSITPYGVFVHFNGGGPTEHEALLEDHGFKVNARFDSINVMYATGTLGDIRVLTHNPSVEYIQANRSLRYLGSTAPWSTRARVAHEPIAGGPYRDPASQILTGSGVGVAIVDSGIDSTHPDLTDRVARNFKIVCSTPGLINTTTEQCFGPLVYQEAPITDNTSGHGTHVSGIVAGDGTASEGTYRGVAPGARLFGYSTGETISVLYAAEAFQHIHDNYDTLVPNIKVINNSYGDDPGDFAGNGPAYNPNDVVSKLTKLLVEQRKVTVAFAAGNSADGSNNDRTSSYCKDPTPGVICVASYNDLGTGSREGTMSTFSSGGTPGPANASRWPDISAPGQTITSTCNPQLAICGPTDPTWAPSYGTISGTSMSTPHIVGAAALMYQAKPDITPAQIEDVFQDTALKITTGDGYVADPQNAGSTISRFKGAGLLDVRAALDALGIEHDGAGGGTSGTPSIAITDPADQTTYNGTTVEPVSGTAFDGVVSGTPTPQTVFSGDGGDVSGFGLLDLDNLVVTEKPTGMEYALTVTNANDRPAGTASTLRITQNVDGKPFLTGITVPPTGQPTIPAASTSNTALATSVSLTGNTFKFLVPFTNMGNPSANSPAHNVFASAFFQGIVDVAPGGPGADVIVRPKFGAYTILRPSVTPPPATTVNLSVDGAPAVPATVLGSSPNYTWSSSVNTMPLADGPHTLLATLLLNGVPSKTSSIVINIERVPVFTDDVGITSPAHSSTVPRALVEVRGFSTSDRPASEARAVTLQVEKVGGGYDSGVLPVTGTSPWTQDVDFGALAAGDYTLTARFSVGGTERATDQITVTVPEPVVYTHEIDITAPANGAEVPRSNVTIKGTSNSTAPAEQSRAVTVQIHNGTYDSGSLTVTGTDNWSRGFDFGTLAPGSYMVTARLFVNGLEEAINEITVTVPDETVETHMVEITSPVNGATVPRSSVVVSGTSSTTSSQGRSVTLQVHNAGYDSGELAATGTNNWTRSFNFGTLTPGSYTLTARVYVGGSFGAIHSISVNVPDPDPTGQVSCAGRGKGWWKQQFADNGKSQKLTDAEADTIAQHAADISNGYFTKSVLIESLSWQGNKGNEKRAARHFATLLLNLAAGNISATMSVHVGLSGEEVLDPGVYDTARIGTTVNAAATWVRAQFPSGDLGGANDVAESINEGIGLPQCGGNDDDDD